MSSSAPRYLVQVEGRLHAYWRGEILLCDLALNENEPVQIYQLETGFGKSWYVPITHQELRDHEKKEEEV